MTIDGHTIAAVDVTALTDALGGLVERTQHAWPRGQDAAPITGDHTTTVTVPLPMTVHMIDGADPYHRLDNHVWNIRELLCASWHEPNNSLFFTTKTLTAMGHELEALRGTVTTCPIPNIDTYTADVDALIDAVQRWVAGPVTTQGALTVATAPFVGWNETLTHIHAIMRWAYIAHAAAGHGKSYDPTVTLSFTREGLTVHVDSYNLVEFWRRRGEALVTVTDESLLPSQMAKLAGQARTQCETVTASFGNPRMTDDPSWYFHIDDKQMGTFRYLVAKVLSLNPAVSEVALVLLPYGWVNVYTDIGEDVYVPVDVATANDVLNEMRRLTHNVAFYLS